MSMAAFHWQLAVEQEQIDQREGATVVLRMGKTSPLDCHGSTIRLRTLVNVNDWAVFESWGAPDRAMGC